MDNPTPIIGPHKPRLPPATTRPAHLANRISPQQIHVRAAASTTGIWVPHPQLLEGAGLDSAHTQTSPTSWKSANPEPFWAKNRSSTYSRTGAAPLRSSLPSPITFPSSVFFVP